MARNPVQFQKGISLNEFLSLYGTEQQCFDALYHWRWPNGFVCPNCGHDRGLPVDHTQAPAVLSLQPPDLHYRRHHLRGHQAAPDGVVPGHLLHDPGQERCIGDEAAPPTRHLLQRRMAHAPQADAGDDGARPRASARRVHPSSTMPTSGASAAAASAGAARRARPLSSPRSRTNTEGHPFAREAHRGRGLPTHRNRRLGAAAPEPGHASALRWAGLLQWRDRGRLRA